MVGDRFAKLVVRNFVVVLGGDNHGVHAHRAAIAVFDGDLGFAVRPEKINFFGFANFGEALREAVGQLDGHGHQLIRFVASEAEHQALIAGAAGVHAHGDIGRLTLHRAQHRAGLAIVAVLRAVVAHAANGVSHQFVIIHVRGGGNFSGDHGQAGGHQRFAGHATHGVLLHHFIQHCV